MLILMDQMNCLGALSAVGNALGFLKIQFGIFLMPKIVFKKVFLGQFCQIKFLKGHQKKSIFCTAFRASKCFISAIKVQQNLRFFWKKVVQQRGYNAKY